MSKETKSRFVQVKCSCGNEPIIFGNAATQVKCTKCNKVLAEPTGGRAKIQTKILKVLE